MVCRAAAYNVYFIERAYIVVRYILESQFNSAVFNPRACSLSDYVGLFDYLLYHEVLVPALFGRIGIPVDGHGFFGDLFFVH